MLPTWISGYYPESNQSHFGREFETRSEAQRELAPEFISARAAASELNVSNNAIHRARKNQLLGFVQLSSGMVFFEREDIRKLKAVKDFYKFLPKTRQALHILADTLEEVRTAS